MRSWRASSAALAICPLCCCKFTAPAVHGVLPVPGTLGPRNLEIGTCILWIHRRHRRLRVMHGVGGCGVFVNQHARAHPENWWSPAYAAIVAKPRRCWPRSNTV